MLYLVRGLPGSGKSTFATTHFKGIIHFENDMFHMIDDEEGNILYKFVEDMRMERSIDCHKFTMKALRRNIPVVVSNVFATKTSIQKYMLAAKALNIETKVYRMISQFQNQHDVPQDTLKWMIDHFEDWDGEIKIDANEYKLPTQGKEFQSNV